MIVYRFRSNHLKNLKSKKCTTKQTFTKKTFYVSDVNSISTEAHETERVQSKPDIHVLHGATIFVSHITKSITKYSRM